MAYIYGRYPNTYHFDVRDRGHNADLACGMTAIFE